MKTDTSFSISRFSLLFNQFRIYNGKLILISILGLIGGLFVMLYSIQIVTRFDTWRYEHFMYLFMGLFMVLAIVYSGSSFPGLRSREKSYNYLLLPATTTEKFLFELLMRVLLFIPVMPALYWTIFHLEGNLVELLNSDFTFQSFSFTEGFHMHTESENNWMIIFVAGQGLLFLTVPFFGATVFMKQPIIKSLAWAIGVLYVLFFLLNHLLKNASPHVIHALTSCIFLVNISMVVMAYSKLKSKQI